MQPLQSTVATPPSAGRVTDTPQLSPRSVKDPQPTKNLLQKGAGKSPDALSNSSLNLILLSLVNQLIEQMQGVDTQSQAGNSKADALGKEGKDKVDGPHQITPNKTSLTANKSSNRETGEISPAPDAQTQSGVISNNQSEAKTESSAQATSAGPARTKNEDTPHPDGLRSLAKVKISLIGFSGQNNTESQDVFMNKMFMEGRFNITPK